jgi:cholest-4-en-3-one 26-monooxygenase
MTQEASLGLTGIDLNNLDLFVTGDLHAVWRRLRREAPVFWSDGTAAYPGFWSITKYEDIVAISRDPATFSSAGGILLTTDPATAHTLGRSMITMDPPRHVRLRRLVSRGFAPRRLESLEPQIRALAVEILDGVAPHGRCDFVVDVAARLPLAVICGMMGVPREDWQLIFDLTNRVLGPDDAEYQTAAGDRAATRRAAAIEMTGYFERLIAARRRAPGADLVSAEPLTDEELVHFCRLLIQAGNETTRHAISGGMLALIEHPEQRDLLLAQPGLLPSAVEEILRWTSPVLHMTRTATRDVAIRGRLVRAGERVVLWYPSANRDEDVFPDGDRFDARRSPNEHIAFGLAEHFCLGASLARLELRVMFEELLRRLPAIELDGTPERLRSNFLGGYKHMPVRFTSA